MKFVHTHRNESFGKIILSSKKIPVSDGDYAQAWVNEVKEKGLVCLPKDSRVESLLLRAQFIEQQKEAESENQLEERLRDSVNE